MRQWIAGLVLALSLGSPAVIEAQTASPCRVSSDPEYGLTPQKAIQTGGGLLVGSGRQRRYLSLLRGPAGEPVIVASGVGSGPIDPGSKVIIDRYSVSYETGKPIALYLNMYAFETPQLPQGFTCSESLSAALGPPPPDAAVTVASIVAHAIAVGAARPIAPITITDAAGTPRALIFDFFNMASSRARLAAGQGGVLDPKIPPATMIIGYPLTCADAPLSPTAIDVLNAQGRPAPRAPQLGSGPQITGVAPGMALPAGAVGALFPSPAVPAPGNLRITYPKSETCADLPTEIVVPLRVEASRMVTSGQSALPKGLVEPDPSVFLQALVDVDGTFKQASYIAGPQTLTAAAIDALATWQATPARLNGEPVVSSATLRVPFK
jgi:hypothetical protein